MKYISSSEIENFTRNNQREAQGFLPLLLRKLIINAIGFDKIKYIDIPGGDSIWKPGVDGKIVPLAESFLGKANQTYIIECGQNKNIAKKIKNDFIKRSQEKQGIKSDDIFVFITSQKINKSKILQDLQTSNEKSLWKDVKIFDADDIELWLEHDWATTTWVAEQLKNPTSMLRTFDKYWSVWLSSTFLKIDENMILARTKDFTDRIIQWILTTEKTSLLKIKSYSKKESILYFMASLLNSKLNKDIISSIISKILIVEDEITWREVTDCKSNKQLILIPEYGVPKDLSLIIDEGYKVLLPLDSDDGGSADKGAICLDDINTHMLYPFLRDKTNYDLANNIIRKIGNNISLLTLQRVLEREDSVLEKPQWTDFANSKYLFLAAIIGSWDESNEKDVKFVEKVFDETYSEIIRNLSFFTRFGDKPIFKKGNIWFLPLSEKIISYLGKNLIKEDFDRYLKETAIVLSTTNPRYSQNGISSFFVPFDFDTHKHTYYSEELVKGIAKGYAMISNHENYFNSDLHVSIAIQNILSKILNNNDWKLWATLSHNFSPLIEAAPNIIINMKESIHKVIGDIYKKSFSSNECIYAGFLFAFESLAYLDRYFVYCVDILLVMDDEKSNISDTQNNWINSARGSLFNIFCPWMQNTTVSLDKRREKIVQLLKTNSYNDSIFNLIYDLLRGVQTSSVPSPKPQYIPIPQTSISDTQVDIFNFNEFIFSAVLSMLNNNANRWERIINYIDNMMDSEFNEFLNKIEGIDWKAEEEVFKIRIYHSLKRWSEQTSSDEIAIKDYSKRIIAIEQIIKKIDITDSIERNIDIFSSPFVYNDSEKSSYKRQEAIKEIYSQGGINEVIKFCNKIEMPHILGLELFHFLTREEDIRYLLNSKENNKEKVKDMLKSFFSKSFHVNGVAWLDKYFDNTWDEDYKIALICSINMNLSYLEWIDRNNLSSLYWKNIRLIYASTLEEYNKAIMELYKFKRGDIMLYLIFEEIRRKNNKNVRKEDILFVLKYFIEKGEIGTNYVQHQIVSLIKELESREDISADELCKIEIVYIEIFKETIGIKPIAIYKVFKKDVNFLMEILKIIIEYKDRDIESGEQEINKKTFTCAYKVYEKIINEFIFENENEFKRWEERLFEILGNEKYQKYKKLALRTIGKMIAHAPIGADKVWPIEYVRDFIEKRYSDDLELGIKIEKFNSVGIREINLRDPGHDWMQWSNTFQKDADKIRFKYPCTAHILDNLAEDYKHHAQEERENV